ncbi:MAG: A/G-specific adenine glycosylase [Deltaproteobacteria bacterium]|nr:A/G-specific adenine glycosylase [Deltaproteobacteria bacterium]MBI3016651.1 A/G-specific adenine glycosylase [Deltaproteobacteria bacterium]
MAGTAFTKKLLNWYRKKARKLPWRESQDPYRIWLSEVMLQQTQVDTVIPYYERWLKKYPTLEKVAQASEDEILKLWEGLGYYARARNFHKACQEVVQRYKGKVPSNSDQFSALKGVGPYTLAAVQSIVFQKPLAAIDGNIKRIVSRLLRIDEPPSKALEHIGSFLKKNMSLKNPGDFNQALMDIGATICLPKNPKCLLCPISSDCEAFQFKQAHFYPISEEKNPRPHYRAAVGVVWRGDKLLISKRKSEGFLGGLWEFPGGKIKQGESAKLCVEREVKEEVGVEVEAIHSVGVVKHDYTHFSIEMEGFLCRYLKGSPQTLDCADWKWISFPELKKFAFPTANRKLFPLLPKTNPFSSKKSETKN